LGFDISEIEVQGKRVIAMDQQKTINRFLDDWNIKYTKGIKCPMPAGKEMWKDGRRLNEGEKLRYQQLVGALNYFSMTTRYDIAHAVSRLSQMSANPTKGAAKALTRVLRYLRANDKLALEGTITKANKLESYSDSDHAGDRPNCTFSQTGIMITLNGVPVQWASRKQTVSTATSSALAEIYALSETTRMAQLTAWKIDELGVKIPHPITIQVDNSQAISFQRSTCLVSKLRGLVDLRWAWVCELRNQEKVRVTKVNTAYNKADILTKCMPAYKFRMCMRTIQGDQESRNVASLVQVLSS
jgi:invasion protein IalB